MAPVPHGKTGVGKIIPTKVAREEPGAMDATNLLIPVTANEHCLDENGESTHYPDPHCTKKSEEAHDTGHEDHPHSGVSRPTERLESTEESSLGNVANAHTEEKEDGICIACPDENNVQKREHITPHKGHPLRPDPRSHRWSLVIGIGPLWYRIYSLPREMQGGNKYVGPTFRPVHRRRE